LWVRYSSSSAASCCRVLASFNRRGSFGTPAGCGAVWKNDCLIPLCPGTCEVRDLNTLLRRCDSSWNLGAGAGVAWKMEAPGAKLFLAPVLLGPNMLLVDLRWAEWRPCSARLVPDEERWKTGWLGRPGASDILEPDCDRAWFAAKGPPAGCMPLMELDRFMADEGMGIDVMLLFMGARVCAHR
jgi:hypothetical protein